jgi:hypothetical protein
MANDAIAACVAANLPRIGRRTICGAALGLIFLSACEEKPMTVTLDVVLFSYLNRPIFDVFVGKTDIGVAGPWPYSGRGSMSGVQLPLGPQKITWRLGGPEGMPRNGDTVTAKNIPELKAVPRETVFLGVHIYADDTVELIVSQHFPELSAKGQAYDTQWEKKNGK